jgi:hypothetical protein
MSVEEIYKFQRRIAMIKNHMLLCRRSFNINEVMRGQIPNNLVYVEYTEGKYSHYLDDKHLNDFLKFLCLYYQTKSLWYAIDFDRTLMVWTEKQECLFAEYKLKE